MIQIYLMLKHTRSSLDSQKTFIQSYLGAALWAAFIMLLCGLPGQDLPNIDFWEIDIEDKLAHVGVFTILSFLMVYGFSRRHPSAKITFKIISIIIVIGAVYGGITEILQELIFESRFASIADFIADFLGAILGTIIAKIYIVNKAR